MSSEFWRYAFTILAGLEVCRFAFSVLVWERRLEKRDGCRDDEIDTEYEEIVQYAEFDEGMGF